jgi:hypothetical protein
MLFYRLLQQAVVTEPVTCDNVVRPLPQAGEIEVGLLDGYPVVRWEIGKE